ncbi:alpha/beta hydrolase [Actinocorallia longicatena]|uniref:BD-FAE-like domain-containing protein n=1 Tax=Actinocorallia longicatena TaxID=111803 RepID=A0ABP6Q2C5_9ACTN
MSGLCAVPATAAAAQKKVETRTVAFGKGSEQKIAVYSAGKGKKRPAILLIHGGYWWGGSRLDNKGFAQNLARRGYVVFSTGYRLSQQDPWPAQRQDVVAALANIRGNAKKYGINPARVIVVGASAGGQLATMLGVYGKGAAKVRGVVALSPVDDPLLGYLQGGKAGADTYTRRLRQSVVQLLGCTPVWHDPDCWPQLTDATPAEHAGKGDAPMLLFHSTKDFVGPDHSVALRDELKKAGVPVTVVSVPGKKHGTQMLTSKKVFNQLIRWIAARAK